MHAHRARPGDRIRCELVMLKCKKNLMQMRALGVTSWTFDFSGWHLDSKHWTVTNWDCAFLCVAKCVVCLFSMNIHTCSSVVLIVKTVLSNFEYVKYSSLLNTLKGICFDDEQYRVLYEQPWYESPVLVLVLVLSLWSWTCKLWSWSCCSGLGLKNLVLFTQSCPTCSVTFLHQTGAPK